MRHKQLLLCHLSCHSLDRTSDTAVAFEVYLFRYWRSLPKQRRWKKHELTAEITWFVINRFLSRKNHRLCCVDWVYRDLELTSFGIRDDSFIFFTVKVDVICCYPCFYIWSTLLNSANSSEGWCRVWMESTMQFSIVSKKFRQTLCFSVILPSWVV